LDIVLEAVAVLLGLLSVWFAKRDHIAVYPSGMLSTGIFVYILFQANLLGDMLINAYFFVMSIYGWYFWIQKEGNQVLNPIAKMNSKEFKWAIVLFFGAVLFVIGIYLFFDKWTDWTAPVDTFTTALFFVGMWLMARRKIEHWIFWIVGDVISVPLYLYKGLGLTSIQYLIFTLIAILGYIQWKKAYNKELQTA
jgi:nicotinamide mononucleotide transporter